MISSDNIYIVHFILSNEETMWSRVLVDTKKLRFCRIIRKGTECTDEPVYSYVITYSNIDCGLEGDDDAYAYTIVYHDGTRKRLSESWPLKASVP